MLEMPKLLFAGVLFYLSRWLLSQILPHQTWQEEVSLLLPATLVSLATILSLEALGMSWTDSCDVTPNDKTKPQREVEK